MQFGIHTKRPKCMSFVKKLPAVIANYGNGSPRSPFTSDSMTMGCPTEKVRTVTGKVNR